MEKTLSLSDNLPVGAIARVPGVGTNASKQAKTVCRFIVSSMSLVYVNMKPKLGRIWKHILKLVKSTFVVDVKLEKQLLPKSKNTCKKYVKLHHTQYYYIEMIKMK